MPDSENEAALHEPSPKDYSERGIYGDLPAERIELMRMQSNRTIISTISQQIRADNTENHKNSSQSQVSRNRDDDELSSGDADLQLPIKESGTEFKSLDPELITWNGVEDPEYPRNWSNLNKWTTTMLISIYAFVSPVSSSMLSPGLTNIAEDLHIEKESVKSLILSIFVLAWGFAPLLVAPISEMYGRRVVLNTSICGLFAFNLACGFAQTTTQMCILRFLAGFSSSAPLSIGAGVLGDLFDNDHRNFAMAFFSIGPTFGPVFGPIVAGFIVVNLGWRWVFYILAIFNGVVALVGITFYKETYSPILLMWKAQKLRKSSGNQHLRTIFEIADGSTKMERIMLNIKRPIKLLFTNPVVFGLGAFLAFIYGFMYLLIATFPTVWGDVYGFGLEVSGLMYIPMGVGFAVGQVVWTTAIGKVYRMRTAKFGEAKPEFRLPTLIFAGIGTPIGLLWYGWSVQAKVFWLMPAIGSAIFAFNLIDVFQSVQNYLIDMNPRFAASSWGAATVFRAYFGFAFPLFATYMYDSLGYGWGNTLCALIALVLGIPFPFFMTFYGERLRNWGNRRMNADQERQQKKFLRRLEALNSST